MGKSKDKSGREAKKPAKAEHGKAQKAPPPAAPQPEVIGRGKKAK